ncbi:cyclic nucleotide-binding domain-containing protein [Actinomadura sp. 7K507]|uniref:cyclic nucleotide-binding domain-containing protein n=1 Tax=Actinomadura sp. 7K507 TaxID=2530365 RepID=UPI001044AA93|nr:cyclic nucleotide-binding domain-containing protein [Actinomadura sp. 7K507]TDC76956.1 cyclic nucleotide-binding domain-containing protein [Actinomadura sp. 7K507]
MSTDRSAARLWRQATSHGGTGLLNAKVTTPVTLLAVLLGYALDGSPGAIVTGGLTFLSLPAVTITNALVQYLRAGTLREPSGPAPPPGPAPPVPAATRAVEPLPGRSYDGATFWGTLTPGEQQALLAAAHRHVFRKEDVLCREGGPAGEVIVILSGWTRVWVEEGPEQRIIAFRGAGELVGERAALMVKDRSATVTAEGDVHALRVGARDFAAFLNGNPRVRAVLERLVYRRQVERPARDALPEWSGGNCTVLITDITGFSAPSRTDADRRYVLDAMYRLLDEAFAASGLVLADFYQEDRGDGALIVIPPTTPTEAVIDPMLAHLAAALRRHNRRAADATRMRLRAALHVGPVQRGPKGVSGISIITARRMVDAPAVKKQVAETGADLAFVTSDFVFDTVITSAPGFVDPGRYARVRVRVKETSLSAWLTLEGGTPKLRAM